MNKNRLHVATFWLSLFIVVLMVALAYQNYEQSVWIKTLFHRVTELENYIGLSDTDTSKPFGKKQLGFCWSESGSEFSSGNVVSLCVGKFFCEEISHRASQNSAQKSTEYGCESLFHIFSFLWWLVIFIVSVGTSYFGCRFVDCCT